MKKRNLRNKSLSVLSTAVLLGALTPHVSAATTLSDIPNNYAKQAILELVEKGIMNGTGNGKFNPTSNISRQDFAIVLARSLNLDLSNPPATATFKDLPKDHYAFAAVEAAVKAGLVKGTGGGQFGTGQNLTREQMAVIFVNALAVDATGKGKDLKFSDSSSIASWAKDAVAAAVEFGLMSGNPDGSFSPSNSASRQDLALVASKFLTEKVKVDDQHKAEQESSKPTAPVETKPPVVTPTPSPTPPVIVTPPSPSNGPILTGVSITNSENETYYSQAVTPSSSHDDIQSVRLWKKEYGMFGPASTETEVLNYSLGTPLSGNASYHLIVTDGHESAHTETWFTVISTRPAISDVIQSQSDDLNKNAYDQGDEIYLPFNMPIQKFDSQDEESWQGPKAPHPGLTLNALESALKKVSPAYTLGINPELITQDRAKTIHGIPYGNIFRLVLGQNANIPSGGVNVTLDLSTIVGPSGLQASEAVIIRIPEIINNRAPIATQVSITGNYNVGSSLTGSYHYVDEDNDEEGSSTYQWYRSDSTSGQNKTKIDGATTTSYIPTAMDNDKYLSFEVTPVALTGNTTGTSISSDYVQIKDVAPVISGVDISTEAAEQPYYNQNVIPSSNDQDISSVQLSTTNPEGLDYNSSDYSYPISGYRLGDEISANGNYKLVVEDEGGNSTTTYFTIDKIIPDASSVIQEQSSSEGSSPLIYDEDDIITISFNDMINKYDSDDLLFDTNPEFSDSGLTLDRLEAALKKVDINYTFGQDSRFIAKTYWASNPLFGNEFSITLRTGANLPSAGVELTLDSSDIVGPSGKKAINPLIIKIPALVANP